MHKKNIAKPVTEQITPFQHVSKNNDMMKTKETHMQGLSLLKNPLYNTFSLLLVIKKLIENK